MVNLYLYKWDTPMGKCIENGKLTGAAKTWQRALRGVTPKMLSTGFYRLKDKYPSWPPTAFEFKFLCLASHDVPTTDEIVKILTCGTGDDRTLASRNKHPIVLAVRSRIDMYNLRTKSMDSAAKMVRAIVDDLLTTGYPGWPDHAHEQQKSIASTKNVVIDRQKSLEAIEKLKQATFMSSFRDKSA